MARINLLPWRQELRKERQRQFFWITGLSLLFVVLVVVAVHLQIARMINVQNARSAYLQRHIDDVEKQLAEIKSLEEEKARLLARMNIIQQLQRNRPEIVRLFDEVAHMVPDGVSLKSLKQQGRSITIDGVAQTNARVSSFMRNIDGSITLHDPLLQVIQTDAKSPERARSFVLRATQKAPEEGEAAAEGAKPARGGK